MNKVLTKQQIRRNRILRALLDHGPLSLTDLARQTGISLPMVSRIATDLKREKLVMGSEEKRSNGAGRPPIVVALNGEAGYVIGIDLGHRNTNLVLINLRQAVVAERHVGSPLLTDANLLMARLSEEIDRLLSEAKVSRRLLLGIGVSIPGIVRGRDGMSETYLNFGGKSTRDVLQQSFRKPVHIEHDAKAMALGEKWFGAARGVSHALVLNIGWGLGLGAILDGRLFYGRDGYAAEFGHILAVPNGRLCYCGKRGCLETVASGMAIGREARERIAAGAVTGVSAMVNGDPDRIDAAKVVQAAVEGDQFSIEILEEAGRYLGEGVAKLINLFNPELVIFGGRVSLAGNFILDPIRSTALKQSLIPLGRGVEFAISSLGPNAGAMGVAMLAARDLFEVEHLNPSAFV